MRGLIYKDFMVLLRVGKVYLAMLVVYFFLTLTDLFAASFFSTLLAVLMITIPLSTFSYDESARWDKFAASTPAGREGVVRGKYCFLLLCCALLTVLILAITLLFFSIKGDWSQFPELLVSTAAVVWVSLLINLIICPLVFRFGPEKARVLIMVILASLFLLIFGAATFMVTEEELSHFVHLLGESVVWVFAVFFVLAAAGFVISYRISLGIFRHREF